ncbi:MAG TPA: APC family permease [Actinomycetota bacterium]|nr:APC family permease [Actinomycetota bacterium]
MAPAWLKRVLLGYALPSGKAEHQLLPKSLALPVFASDQLSSVAYATEQMMLVLVTAGAGALSVKVPAGFAIAALLAIVITSYRQTVHAYPRGGGSYIVSRENLGTIPGLVAAGAIQTSYVLTVSVSVTAGTIAVTSAAPALVPYKVPVAIGFVVLITVANLRGVKEAGRIFAIPTYGFVAMVFLTLAIGFIRCLGDCPRADTADLELEATAALTTFLVLRAFSSGATALTGVEAIADGVQAFRRPQARNAAATLAIMGALSIPMFLGITVLARMLHVRVTEEVAASRSVLAQIGDTVFGGGWLFITLQVFTTGILILAANTAYQDFPRLSAILARDRFMPVQFKNRGDRLVFSNGIVVLSVLASLLIWLFNAELSALIHLYVVGVFAALTLSQAGMVRRWLRKRGEGWQRGIAINLVGATTTGLVLAIVAVTQFRDGAWIVISAVPVIVALFLAVHRHYEAVGRILRTPRLSPRQEVQNTFVLLVSDLGPHTTDAIAYMLALRPERVIPLFIGSDGVYQECLSKWRSVAPRLGPLERLDGEGIRALLSYIRRVREDEHREDFVTVVVPELISTRSMVKMLRRRSAFWLKAALLFEPRVVVTDVPLVPEEHDQAIARGGRPLEPERSVVLVPVSAVHNATVRAVVYAKSLKPSQVEALFFAADPEEVEETLHNWGEWGMDIPLSAIDTPFRDIATPLLEEVRKHTRRGDTIVTVVLPEFVVRRWWEHLLHNQTGLYIKRLLLYEPRVVVTSVPYHLGSFVRVPPEELVPETVG